MQSSVGAVLVVALLSMAASAQATTVQLIETHPPLPATLPNGHDLNLRVRVDTASAQDVFIQEVRSGGKRVAWFATNGIDPVPAGGGETVLFTFLQPGEGDIHVDEIVVKTTEAGMAATRDPAGETHVIPVDVTWTAATSQTELPDPPWVTDHRAKADARRAAARAATPPPGPFENLLWFAGSILFLVLAVGAVWLPIRWIRRWKGGWRIAAAACLVPVPLSIANIALGLLADPTSHNLFPFEIAMAGAVAYGLMIVVGIAHVVATGRNSASRPRS